MDNNKGLRKNNEKSNPELRKMYFNHGRNIGIDDNGHKVGMHEPNFQSLKADSEKTSHRAF